MKPPDGVLAPQKVKNSVKNPYYYRKEKVKKFQKIYPPRWLPPGDFSIYNKKAKTRRKN